jgi:hypothetical protein
MPSELVSAGYYLVQPYEPHLNLSEGLLPSHVLSLSACVCESFPGTWALEWVEVKDGERAKSSAEFGVPEALLPSLITRATALFNEGSFMWPDVFRDLEVARSFARDFLPARTDVALIELGLPSDIADTVVQALASVERRGPTGVHTALSARRLVHHDAGVIGWEPLDFDWGQVAHSWLCNGIHVDASQRLGIRPGRLGLLSSEDEARAVTAMIVADGTADPGVWVPTALIRHDLAI